MGELTGLVCPECGASNRAGETACFLCGHGLDALRPETRTGVPKAPTSPDVVNPYEPPTTFVSPLTSRISSLLMVIAVIAVCLGVAHENLVLGIIQAIAVAPALVYTVIVAAQSTARGRPMAVFKKVSTFLAALVGVVVIAVSAFIAFFVTCLSVGIASEAGYIGRDWDLKSLVTACVYGGGTAAIAVAAYMTYFLVTRKGRRGGSPGKP